MAKELIINATLPETRLATLEDGDIQELYIERDSEKGIVGNIYKGKVLRVLPGMQAAFVDIGHEKAAFLYVDDVYFPDMENPMSTNDLPESVDMKAIEESIAQQPAREEGFRERPRHRRFDRNNKGGRNDRNNNRGRNDRNNNRGRNNQRGGTQQRGMQRRSSNPMLLRSMIPGRNNPTPGSPEEFALHQQQFGHQMLDISEEQYLAELEAKRKAAEAAKLAGGGSTSTNSEEVPDDIGNRVTDASDLRGTELGTDEDTQEIAVEELAADDLNDEEVTQAEEFEDEEEIEKEEIVVAPKVSTNPHVVEEEEDDEVETSIEYRPEPEIDMDAWAAEVAEVQPPHSSEVAIAKTDVESEVAEVAEVVETQNAEVNQTAAVEAKTDMLATEVVAETAEVAAEAKPQVKSETTARAPQRHNRFQNRNNNRQPRNIDEDDLESVRKFRRREPVKIENIVKEGMELIVQVQKDPIATKGARLTCHVSLPGRYLVFMPSVDHIGVSRRIESELERRRLKEIISHIKPPKTGVIVRTASGKQTDQKLKDDLDYLVRTWNEIQKKFTKQKSPSVVYQDLNIVLRTIRDVVSDDVDKIIVDSEREHKNINRFISKFMPNLSEKLEQYKGEMPIFDYFNIEPEIERALEKKVWLKSGGYIVIDQAEALVAIDVNTGRYVGKKTLEETILKTNLEAVEEIAYQMRLRNCGGIIIIDLIDMERDSNKEKVYKALEEALKKDRARPTIMRISQLGLIEMTRKRTRDTIVRSLCQSCNHCKGRGFVKNPLTISYDVLREVERESFEKETKSISIQCHPEVADILLGDKRDVLENLEHDSDKKVSIRANGAYPLEHYEISAAKEDGKSETMSNEERRQKTRTKINQHIQGMQAEQRKQAAALAEEQRQARAAAGEDVSQVSGAEGSMQSNGDPSSAAEGESRSDAPRRQFRNRSNNNRRGGRNQGNQRNRHHNNRGHSGQNRNFQQNRNQATSSEAGIGEQQGNESQPSQMTENMHYDSIDSTQKQLPTDFVPENAMGNDQAAQVPNEMNQSDANAEGNSTEGAKEMREPSHHHRQSRGRHDNRRGGGRTGGRGGRDGRDNRRGGHGGGGRRERTQDADATPKKSRWDYVREKYFGNQEGPKKEDTAETVGSSSSEGNDNGKGI